MADVGITIPDEIVQRMIAAMHNSYPDTVEMDPVVAFRMITSKIWATMLVDYEGQLADAAYARAHNADVAAARAQATIDTAGIV